MADQSDCETAIETLIDAILYPNGDGSSPITGYQTRIYRGNPTAATLDADLANGIAHITVFEAAGFSRLTGGYLDGETATPNTPTINITVSGYFATIGGTASAGQLVGLAVNGATFVYAFTPTDTLATAATALGALVSAAGLAVAVYGATLDFSGGEFTFGVSAFGASFGLISLLGAVSCLGKSQTFPRWQCQGFDITIWAPTPEARDGIASYLDAQLSNTRWITLVSDGQQARFEWRNTFTDDVPQKEQLWKRRLIYTVQFATSITTNPGQVLWSGGNLTVGESAFVFGSSAFGDASKFGGPVSTQVFGEIAST